MAPIAILYTHVDFSKLRYFEADDACDTRRGGQAAERGFASRQRPARSTSHMSSHAARVLPAENYYRTISLMHLAIVLSIYH